MVLIAKYYLIQGQLSHLCKKSFSNCPSLHSLLRYIKDKIILVDNGQYVGVLFVIPVVMSLQGHRFEGHTLVLEICGNVYMVMGIKMCIKSKE